MTTNIDVKVNIALRRLSEKKKKKIRKLPIILLIVVILLIALVVYIVHSYNSGVEYAKKHAKDVKVHQFNGPVKMMVKFLFLYSVQIKHKVDNQEQILSWLFNMTLSIKNENDVCHA